MEKSERIYGDYFKIIQNVINRMARTSFLIKAWEITLISTIIVLTINFTDILVFGTLIGITFIFWILDSYYLWLEKIYRCLYNSKVEAYNDETNRETIVLFDMDYTQFRNSVKKLPKLMISKSEGFFYIPILIALINFTIFTFII